jgi:hypothetical protein
MEQPSSYFFNTRPSIRRKGDVTIETKCKDIGNAKLKVQLQELLLLHLLVTCHRAFFGMY